MVAGPGSIHRLPIDIQQIFSLPFHRCRPYGVGSTSGGRHTPRRVGTTGRTPHQSAGDESSGQSPPSVLSPSGCHSSGVFGQLHPDLPHKHGDGDGLFPLWKETKLPFQLASKLWISLGAVHIPGKMNIIASLLSHQDQTLPTEWSLNSEVTKHMFRLWGSSQVDLFVTRWNAKC